MENVLFNVDKKSDVNFLITIAKRLGITAKTLSQEEVEDWKLAQRIEKGMKTPNVSRTEVMKVLGK